jgi:SAM-dependent methyltransferase
MADDRYQDYVIRDGKFVGDFERMYQRFDDPWHQTEDDHTRLSLAKNSGMLLLRKYGVRSVVEFGCGLGHTTELIRRSTDCEVLGVDVSETAIARARGSFPDCRFAVDTISNLTAYANFDAVFFADVTWFILPDLSRIFEQMIELFSGKIFVQNLTFYGDGVQQYGREYFTSFDEFVSFCPLQLLEWMTCGKEVVDGTKGTSAAFRIDRKQLKR